MSASLYQQLIKEGRRKLLLTSIGVQGEILEIYEDVIEELATRAQQAKDKSLTERWLKDYIEKGLRPAQRELARQLDESIRSAMMTAGSAGSNFSLQVFSQAMNLAEIDLGPHFTDMFSTVPELALRAIINGGLYKDGRGLSQRIWFATNNFARDIDYMLKKGIAAKKSAIELARDLETFVKPGAQRPWSWGKVYPNLRSRQVDYNAQRLARTSITHAFRESQYESARRNPFAEAIHWELSDQHYERQIKHYGPDECDDYANQNWYGLGKGNFPKDEVPLSHPQCLCHTYPVVAKSLDQIARELQDWLDGGSNPVLDEWYWKYGQYYMPRVA